MRISRHHYDGVLLADFLDGLIAAGLKAPPRTLPARPGTYDEVFQLRADAPLTIRRLIARLNQSLDESIVVIADIGDALFASSDLVIHRQTEYLAPAYYTSMGFAVPAALGVMVARPDLRPIVLVGDGAFQMTGMELSSVVRYGFQPIVIVLDNRGYGTERRLHAGESRLQRRAALALLQAAGTARRRHGLRRAERRRVRPRLAPGPGRPLGLQPDSRASRPARRQPGFGAAGQAAECEGVRG